MSVGFGSNDLFSQFDDDGDDVMLNSKEDFAELAAPQQQVDVEGQVEDEERGDNSSPSGAENSNDTAQIKEEDAPVSPCQKNRECKPTVMTAFEQPCAVAQQSSPTAVKVKQTEAPPYCETESHVDETDRLNFNGIEPKVIALFVNVLNRFYPSHKTEEVTIAEFNERLRMFLAHNALGCTPHAPNKNGRFDIATDSCQIKVLLSDDLRTKLSKLKPSVVDKVQKLIEQVEATIKEPDRATRKDETSGDRFESSLDLSLDFEISKDATSLDLVEPASTPSKLLYAAMECGPMSSAAEVPAADKKKKRERKISCFNCGGNHNMADCKEPKDYAKIAENLTANRKQKKHDKKVDPKFARFKAGELSTELRSALGLSAEQAPPWVYQMRTVGYPPGHLIAAEINSPNIKIFDDGGDLERDKREVKVEQILAEEKLYRPDEIVRYPGFNAPLPEDVIDESHRYYAPPMDQELDYDTFVTILKEKLEEKMKKTVIRPLSPGEINDEDEDTNDSVESMVLDPPSSPEQEDPAIALAREGESSLVLPPPPPMPTFDEPDIVLIEDEEGSGEETRDGKHQVILLDGSTDEDEISGHSDAENTNNNNGPPRSPDDIHVKTEETTNADQREGSSEGEILSDAEGEIIGKSPKNIDKSPPPPDVKMGGGRTTPEIPLNNNGGTSSPTGDLDLEDTGSAKSAEDRSGIDHASISVSYCTPHKLANQRTASWDAFGAGIQKFEALEETPTTPGSMGYKAMQTLIRSAKR